MFQTNTDLHVQVHIYNRYLPMYLYKGRKSDIIIIICYLLNRIINIFICIIIKVLKAGIDK